MISYFKNNYGYFLNLIRIFFQAIYAFKRRINMRNLNMNWQDYSSPLFDRKIDFSRKVPLNDVATGVWLRIIIENDFKRVIEIGTRHGQRIRAIKKLLPNLECIGLDISKEFKKTFYIDDVCFKENKTGFFKKNKKKTIVISRGCLQYYPADELEKLFKKIHSANYSISYFEPHLAGIKKSLVRFKPDKSHYHPYENILNRNGFDTFLKDKEFRNYTTKFTYMTSTIEHWFIGYAEPNKPK